MQTSAQAIQAAQPTTAPAAEIMTSKAYYVGLHRYHFQENTPAEILGVKMVTASDGKTQRPCYHLRYPDGQEDYVPMQDEDFVGKGGLGVLYEVISQEQLDAGQIPQTRA